MDFRQQYKKKKFGFGDAGEGRILRAEKLVESRKEQRAQSLARIRNLDTVNERTPNKEIQPVVVDRKHKLIQWKMERDRHRKLQQRKKKPAFKVGVVHHNFYSPVVKEATVNKTNLNDKSHMHVKPPPNPSMKGITKATEKRLLAKAAAMQQQNVSKTVVNKKKATPDKKQKESFAPVNHQFKPPAGVSSIPFFGRVSIPKTPIKPQSSRKSSTRSAIKRTSISSKNETKEPSKNDSNLSQIRQMVGSKKVEEVANTTDSSIETVSLRLSSDEQEISSPPKKNNLKAISPSSNTSTRKTSSPLDVTTPEQPKDNSCNEPVFFSPYIVCSRGKSNARKEQQVKRGLGCSPTDNIPTKESVMKSLNISTEEEEKTAQYFKFLLNREIERLKELCDKWSEIKYEAGITEDAQYQINQAIGQTSLLLNKKFERFRGLVLDCETGKGEMLVTCKDLQGFWDMMYMEIKDCDSRFDKLEKLRARNWVEEQPVIIKPVVKKKIGQKKKVVSTKQSSIKALISAAKKKKMLANADNSGDPTSDKGCLITFANNNYSDSVKRRRSRSLGPGHDKFTPVKRDSVRLSLLQTVQLSETSKKIRSPLTIIKISQMCKTPEVHLDDTISYVNSDQTPGKSILKKSDDVIEKELRTKSAHKVNFNDQVVLNEVPVDDKLNIKLDLAVALTRIDSYDLDRISPEVPIKVERKLNFEDDSSEESENIFQDTNDNDSIDKVMKEDNNEIVHISPKFARTSMNENLRGTPRKKYLRRSMKKNDGSSALLPSVNVITATPLAESKTNNELNTTYEKEESDTSIMILRSKSIRAKKTLKNSRSTKEFMSEDSAEKKENKSPKKVRRSKRSSMKAKEFSEVSTDNAFNEIAVDDNTKTRRSTRKSVRFTAEDCTACVETKPVLPMTPHSRRSKTKSRESESKNTSAGDLISWETPQNLPLRVRRSQMK